jgi:hypothetical protein
MVGKNQRIQILSQLNSYVLLSRVSARAVSFNQTVHAKTLVNHVVGDRGIARSYIALSPY